MQADDARDSKLASIALRTGRLDNISVVALYFPRQRCDPTGPLTRRAFSFAPPLLISRHQMGRSSIVGERRPPLLRERHPAAPPFGAEHAVQGYQPRQPRLAQLPSEVGGTKYLLLIVIAAEKLEKQNADVAPGFVTTRTRFFGAGAPQNFTPLENSPPPRKMPPPKKWVFRKSSG
jgi:hypothetical protein